MAGVKPYYRTSARINGFMLMDSFVVERETFVVRLMGAIQDLS